MHQPDPGTELEELLPHIEATLDSHPDARLATSLDHLARTDEAERHGLAASHLVPS